MMLTNSDFFHIQIEMLENKQIFPFQIYVWNPMNNQYLLFLHGNSPLIKDKWQLLNFIIEKGGGIAILMDQKKTFLTSMELDESDVPSLASRPPTQLETARGDNIQALRAREEEKGKFSFKDNFMQAISQDDFTDIIEQARLEIIGLKITISHTVSLARFLCEELLYEDNLINRIVAVSYHFAKGCGIDDQASLGSIVCAAFFHHLGYTQIDHAILKRPQIELGDDWKKQYRQHPGLAQHLLKKSQVELDERTMAIILDHHERFDGTGYPSFKQGSYIDPLALILGAVGHIFEYKEGKVTGTKTPLQSVIFNIKNKTLTPGLELNFGDLVYNNLIHIINAQNLAQKETPSEMARAA